jgi:hypothetical protein
MSNGSARGSPARNACRDRYHAIPFPIPPVPDHSTSTPKPSHSGSNGAAAQVTLSPSPAAEHAISNPDNIDADEQLVSGLAAPTAESGDPSGRAPIGTTPVTIASRARKPSLIDRVEAFISRLSTRNNFWHRVCSLIWLPFAFRSGIKMKRLDDNTFNAVLPFRRFNRNWYNAMAGAALLGNAEIAGGMYVFGVCGGDYTVVCKHLEYKFLRPCFGPAVYRLAPRENIEQLLAHGGEFNIIVDMDVFQGIAKAKSAKDAKSSAAAMVGGREKRVGRCAATFHVTPKAHHKNKKERQDET